MSARKIIKRERVTVKRRVIYVVIGLFVWTLVSFAFLQIAIEGFQNKEDYLILGLWIGGIILGYVVLLYMLGVRKKKKEDEDEVQTT